jgi:hypothetical protein
MSRFALLLLGLVLAGMPTSVPAWGSLGHEIVAEIAARELTPEASAEVERLLGDRAPNALRDVANWADEWRERSHHQDAALHFVNFQRDGDCRYQPKRECREGRCVVGAIERFTRELRESRDPRVRRNALRWLVHLVADVHQPLHAGYGDDRGGNDVQLRFHGKGTNLHQVLDSGLLGLQRRRPVGYAEWLLRSAPANGESLPLAWDPGAPARWAMESCALVPGVYPGDSGLGADYERRVTALLEARLLTAGHRLASTLNAALALP